MLLFSFGGIIEAVLLFINALAILNEERFLRDYGWAYDPTSELQTDTIRYKLISLLHSIRFLLRVPLIAVNSVYIVYLLILG